MQVQETIRNHYASKFLGWFCPKCYSYSNFGDVNVDVDIKLEPSMPISMLEVYPTSITDDYGTSLVSVGCPHCDISGIIVDAAVLDTVVKANQYRIFTAFSCDGLEDGYPYLAIPIAYKEVITNLSSLGATLCWDEEKESATFVINDVLENVPKYAGIGNLRLHFGSIRDLIGIYLRTELSRTETPESASKLFWESVDNLIELIHDYMEVNKVDPCPAWKTLYDKMLDDEMTELLGRVVDRQEELRNERDEKDK